MATGVLITKIFKLPNWVSPAVAFNNTTSLPLLLIQSLETTGVLDTLLQSPDDTASKVVKRAQSYFLINAIVSNTLTFGMGPKLLNGFDEEGPEDDKDKSAEDGENGEANGNTNGNANGNGEEADEQTSLLPRNVRHHARRVGTKANDTGAKAWEACNPKVQAVLSFCWEFLNAPLIGAVIGAIVGLTPGLHRAFFNDTQEGGFFNAWLTSAIKNVGDLFAALQVVVVGVKLSQSMRSMKQGKESGHVPWPTFAFISFVRYVFWPLISIPLIWVLAAKTNALPSDPVLWFTMMLMPAGPPAMKLTALADVNGSPEEEKMSIAKFLTVGTFESQLNSVLLTISLAVLHHLPSHLFSSGGQLESGQGCSWTVDLPCTSCVYTEENL